MDMAELMGHLCDLAWWMSGPDGRDGPEAGAGSRGLRAATMAHLEVVEEAFAPRRPPISKRSASALPGWRRTPSNVIHGPLRTS